MSKLPDFVIETIKLADGRRIRVIRDDIVPGGSKQRALVHMLKKNREYVYPATAYGYAQIALALAAKTVGARATLFIAKRAELHPRTLAAQQAGAQIMQIPNGMQSVITRRVKDYSAEHSAAIALLSGFDSPEFIDAMSMVAEGVKLKGVEQVWCNVGTGAIARALQQRWPKAQFSVVRTGMGPTLGPKMKLYEAPEVYSKDAKIAPPFPSCSNSDAKTWRFILDDAEDGALFWNVAA
jgi:cysteine synthase